MCCGKIDGTAGELSGVAVIYFTVRGIYISIGNHAGPNIVSMGFWEIGIQKYVRFALVCELFHIVDGKRHLKRIS